MNVSTTNGRTKLLGLLDAGDPRGEVRTDLAREGSRPPASTTTPTPTSPSQFVDRLGHDLQDESCPLEVRPLGRTLIRWRDQIAAWHRAHVTQRADRSGQQPDQAGQAGRVRVHAASGTTGSASCSTPADPTGTYSPPSHPAEIRRATLDTGRANSPTWRHASAPARRVNTTCASSSVEVSVQVLRRHNGSRHRHRRFTHTNRAGRPKQARSRTATRTDPGPRPGPRSRPAWPSSRS